MSTRPYDYTYMSIEKVEKIVEVLKAKYHPVAILLHGSRAVGKERPHSDWDILMLFDGNVPRRGYREIIDGEDIEWKAFKIPAATDSIIGIFDMNLQFARMLWEENTAGSVLLEKASVAYSRGPQLSPDDIRREKQFLDHKLFGMIDDINTPYMFLRHLGVFFNRVSNLWFEILHNEFPKPFYIAIPEIRERDAEYSQHLEVLYSSTTSREKVDAGRWIVQKLFDGRL